MENKTVNLALLIIGSAFIWAVTIIGCTLLLRGTDVKGVVLLVSTAAVIHFVVILMPLAGPLSRKKDGD